MGLLVPEQQISLYWPETEKEVEARVVERLAREPEGHSYGIEFLDEQADFWNKAFPAINLELDGSRLQ